jgi:DNA polymerase-1
MDLFDAVDLAPALPVAGSEPALAEADETKQARQSTKKPKAPSASAAQRVLLEPEPLPRPVAQAPWLVYAPTTAELLRASTVKFIDTETTALNPGSKPVQITARDLALGANPAPRVRVLTAHAEGQTLGWDLDTLEPEQLQALAAASLFTPSVSSPGGQGTYSGAVIAHNAAFDLAWLLPLAGGVVPSRVLDTMLIARLLAPRSATDLAVIAGRPLPRDGAGTGPEQDQTELARQLLDKGTGGWSLEALALVHLQETTMDKTYQKPHNWVHRVLDAPRHAYATTDASILRRLLARLLHQALCHTPDLAAALSQGGMPALAAIASATSQDAESVPDVILLEAWDLWVGAQDSRVQELARAYEQLPIQLAQLSLRGHPIDAQGVRDYVALCEAEIAQQVDRLVAMEPALQRFKSMLSNRTKGLSADLKIALAQTFESRGLTLGRTAKSNAPQVGEKDLRGAGATQRDATRPLFDALREINRSAKRAGMAEGLLEFAQRYGDGRVHTMFSPRTLTGRLSSSEPNAQQNPNDKAFRALVRASAGSQIVYCDYGALDVRVGEALALRVQLPLIDLWKRWMHHGGDLDWRAERGPLHAIKELFGYRFARSLAELAPDYGLATGPVPDGRLTELAGELAVLAAVKDKALDAADPDLAEQHREAEAFGTETISRKDMLPAEDAYFKHRHKLAVLEFHNLILRIDARIQAASAVTGERKPWGAFADAFNNNIDPHTNTALLFDGQDPMALIAGKTRAEILAVMDACKLEMESKGKRKVGKICNLSLLYGMSAAAFRRHAAKAWDLHLTLDEAARIVSEWYRAYPEIDLWARAMKMLRRPLELAESPGLDQACIHDRAFDAMGLIIDSRHKSIGYRGATVLEADRAEVYVPVKDRVSDRSPRRQYAWRISGLTLSGREVCASSLNAALNYPDQGTGADILTLVFYRIRTDARYQSLEPWLVNQVHDEIVLEVPDAQVEWAKQKLQDVMVDVAENLLLPHGVSMAVEVAAAKTWA